MSVPSSVEELLQLIRKSGMVDEQKLSAYLQRRQLTRGLPADPREFADELVRDGILTYFQSEQFLLGKWRGFTIGKYKLLERVGVGGMGQVFLCEHMFMKRRVAVKVLPPAKADQPAALGRFYREARAAGGLDHPNIVRTHDIDQDGNLHFIVMDYVDGPNLLDIVKKFGPMDLGRAVSYIRQVAGGLDYAFRNALIHRDIKPGNVLIDRKGVAQRARPGPGPVLSTTTPTSSPSSTTTRSCSAPPTTWPRSRWRTATRWTSGRTSTGWARRSTSCSPATRRSRPGRCRRSSSGTGRRTRRRSARSGRRCRRGWPPSWQDDGEGPEGPVPDARPGGRRSGAVPARRPVALPADEEMPLLSPAAMAVMATEQSAEPAAEPVARATVGAGTKATAALAAPAASPFGSAAGSPWGGSTATATAPPPRQSAQPALLAGAKGGSRLAMKPLPASQVAMETATGGEHTPPSKRSNPFLPANPFAGDATAPKPAAKKATPWVLIVCGVAVIVTAALLLAKFTN